VANEIITFPFDVTTDRIRFPQQTIDGKKGYYDIVEKKFISLNVLESLISNLKPEPKYQILSPDDFFIVSSINRIRRNLSLYQKKLSDSYSHVFLKYVSNRFLSSWPEQDIHTSILYVDIVGSTRLATQLPSDELSRLIKIFSQEISILVSKHAGFVLKYTGDAVIAFFPELKGFGNMTENAIRCGYSMNMVVKHALNAAFQDFGLPSISIKVGVDTGKNQIIFLGSQPDLIGHVITIASKIVSLAQPSQISIGEGAHKMICKNMAEQFIKINPDDKRWNYTRPETGLIYPIFFSKTKE